MPASGPEAWGLGRAGPLFASSWPSVGWAGGTKGVESWYVLSMDWRAETQRVTGTGHTGPSWLPLWGPPPPHMGECHRLGLRELSSVPGLRSGKGPRAGASAPAHP